MTAPLPVLIERLARERGVDLPPDWSGGPLDPAALDGEGGLAILAENAGWDAPRRLERAPRANRFPLLAFTPDQGWLLAEQLEGHARLRVWDGTARSIPWDPAIALYDVALPESAVARTHNSAFEVFWRAMLARKDVLIAATVATIVANVITLATSLYSMQIYDRVIPRAGYSTLWVLSIGVLVALLIDFALRTTRSLMIEREAARIDHDVSEYFFARALAVRLDARTGGVGTMAAQLRGLEQVRALMSSGSLFLLADLPFALFFVVVIFALGGLVLALVPLISLPIALGIAWGLARLIRKDTNRAQISGNLKNGLLVESIDAAETIKANRGGWQLLARWNRLIEEIHASEDPVKRWTSAAGSIFATLQQIAYVALIAVGALEVIQGRMTTGALIACAIIAGRVNGPLVTQLPSLIVQWGYARASLKMLDNILDLPMDEDPDVQGLRPGALSGGLRLEGVRFAYPGAREGLDIPRLEIRDGERVAIVGGIGSGKTTLLRLLAGLYRPQEGRAMIGNLDASQIAPDVMREHIGYLAQDYRLVNGTLRENLLLGLSNPGDDAVMRAVGQTGLMQLVSAHPRGLDLPISEGGRGLSGGQRTLVGLTRLLLAKPPVLLLDEPTANLDDLVEGQALGAIASQLAVNSTLVVVTHKLRLLSLVNRVIVMANGRIVLDGPTAEVVKALQAPQQRAKVEASA